MKSLKIDSRNLNKVNSVRKKDDNFYDIFDETFLKLDMTMFGKTTTEIVTLNDHINLQIVNCNFKPKFSTLKNNIWEVKYWNLEILRLQSSKFKIKKDAQDFYNIKCKEFEKMNLPIFDLKIQYLLENDINYFYSHFRIPLGNPVEYDKKSC